MASICKGPGGRRSIQFTAPNGKRGTVRLGKVDLRIANEIKRRIEYIITAAAYGMPPDMETASWLSAIGDQLHDRLSSAGLVDPRQRAQLGPFIASYIAGRTDLKPSTLKNLKDSAARLTGHFGATRQLESITEDDAEKWLAALRKTYAAGTVHRTMKRAKQLFKAALEAGLVRVNPFTRVRSPAGSTEARRYFVRRDVAERILAEAPGWAWRLTFALCRFGGLRCPSELSVLTWGDVDWARKRFLVRSPKTGPRWVPIFPELAGLLDEAWDAAEEGAVEVLPGLGSNSNLRTQFLRILKQLGIKPWPKLFHNLRASRQTELDDIHPPGVVCAWLGNSDAIARKHYRMVTEDHFERAAEGDAKSDAPKRGPDAKRAAATGGNQLETSRQRGLIPQPGRGFSARNTADRAEPPGS